MAAEESALIVNISRWVLREACQQLCQWQQIKPKLKNAFVCVNISSREFENPELVENVTDTLATTGLKAKSLKLELTENVLIENSQRAMTVLNELRNIGLTLSIDFGTEFHPSAIYISFPLTYLKSIEVSLIASTKTKKVVELSLQLFRWRIVWGSQ